MTELVGGKRKLNCKSIIEKYKILKDVFCFCFFPKNPDKWDIFN